jgi:PHD/YefM family antitoxin component YafN of YafNO toxin-antitoxin module
MSKKFTKPQVIVNEKGKQVGVILTIKSYESLIEELEDLQDTLHAEQVIAKTRKFYRLEDVEKKLRKQGALDKK